MTRYALSTLMEVLTISVTAVAAPVVDVDYVIIENGAVVFGDDFNNSLLDMPPWFVAAGTPGPEAGTHLTMGGGDVIATGLGGLNPLLDSAAQMSADLVGLGAG